MDFIDGKNQSAAFAADDQQAFVNLRLFALGRCGRIFKPERFLERNANQQFTADVHQPEDNAVAPMRQGVNRFRFRYRQEHAARQRQPLRPDTEDDNGMRFARNELFLFREMAGPIDPVIGRQFAIEQPDGRGRISRAVPAVDVFFQLRARRVAAHADFVPAIV
jgi:hypothetical protein